MSNEYPSVETDLAQVIETQTVNPAPIIIQNIAPTPEKKNGLAIAGFVLALLGIGAIIPVLGWGALPFAILGLIFSAIGFVKSRKGAPHGGLAKAGLVISLVSILGGIILHAASAGSAPTTTVEPALPPAVVETPTETVTEPAVTETAAPVSPEPEQVPANTISGGDHIVGPNFAAGVYRADVAPGLFSLCTISQSNASGGIMDIRNANSGSVIFNVADEPGTTVNFSGCANIGLAQDRIRTNITEITNGDWLVGDELAAGSYTCTVDTDSVIALGTVTQFGSNGSVIDIRNANEGNVVFNVQDAPGSIVSFSGCSTVVAN